MDMDLIGHLVTTVTGIVIDGVDMIVHLYRMLNSMKSCTKIDLCVTHQRKEPLPLLEQVKALFLLLARLFPFLRLFSFSARLFCSPLF